MRVLYALSPIPDFGESVVFKGLQEALGKENVSEIPYKFAYHGYPGGKVYSRNPTIQKFIREKPNSSNAEFFRTITYVDSFKWMITDAVPLSAEEAGIRDAQILESLDEFDVLFFSTQEISTWLVAKALERRAIPTALVDCADDDGLLLDLLDRFASIAYFKTGLVRREWFPEHSDKLYDPAVHPKVHGIFYSSPIIGTPYQEQDDSWENKTFDFHVSLALTHESRAHIYSHLQTIDRSRASIQDIDGIDFIQNWTRRSLPMTPYEQYTEEIAKSKIAISAGGHSLGRHPFRHFEIPSFRTMLLCQEPLVEYPHPFKDGEHCVFFDPYDRNDFLGKLEYYLSHDDDCRQIADAGYEHLMKYHTSKARAEQMIEIVEGLLA